jgi:transposase InsO family protein
VREEVLTLASRDPSLGCRKLADIFNRRHMDECARVGQTFAADLLKRHQAAIRLRRQELKRRKCTPGKPNLVWGMDCTGKTDEAGQLHSLLGIVDHGTRRCLTLEAPKDKSAVAIVRVLCQAVERYGAPQILRSDNEPVFKKSRLIRAAFKILGIHAQTTEPHCPWQNGRIERLFGTLKEKLNQWAVPDRANLDASLALFRLWHNHVRPHQHLQGRTPAEVWDGVDVRKRPIRRIWFEAWEGLLQGEYLQR